MWWFRGLFWTIQWGFSYRLMIEYHNQNNGEQRVNEMNIWKRCRLFHSIIGFTFANGCSLPRVVQYQYWLYIWIIQIGTRIMPSGILCQYEDFFSSPYPSPSDVFIYSTSYVDASLLRLMNHVIRLIGAVPARNYSQNNRQQIPTNLSEILFFKMKTNISCCHITNILNRLGRTSKHIHAGWKQKKNKTSTGHKSRSLSYKTSLVSNSPDSHRTKFTKFYLCVSKKGSSILRTSS